MVEREEMISRKTTEYQRCNEHNDKDTVTETVKTFKYLASTLVGGGELDAEFNHKGRSGWKDWKGVSDVSTVRCDRTVVRC